MIFITEKTLITLYRFFSRDKLKYFAGDKLGLNDRNCVCLNKNVLGKRKNAKVVL